ncbi:MAG: hypothetical protein ACYC5O_17625, partial [Anaerolineae bacterium]
MTAAARRSATTASIAALALLSLALALRLYRLPAQSLSYDEAVSVYLARLPVTDMLAWTATDVQPPLYYLALKAWLPLAGTGEFALRFLSVMAATVVVALFYRLGRDWAGRSVGIGAALAAALYPWYVWHAQDARMYSQLLLLCLLASWLLLLWWRQQQESPEGLRRRRAVALALPLAYAAAAYTHYLAVPFFAYHLVLVAVAAASARRRPILGRYLTTVVAPAALLYLPWVPAVLATYRGDTSYFAGPVKLAEVVADSFAALFVGGVGETVFERQGLTLALLLAAALVLALIAARSRLSRAKLAVVLGALLLPALCSLALLAVAPKFNPRYLFAASLALPLLWGLAAPRQWRSLAGALSMASTLALVVVSARVLAQTYADPAFTRADFRAAIATVRQGLRSGERVVLSSGHQYPVWQYYAPGVPYLPVPDRRILSVDDVVELDDLAALSRELAGAQGVWVVRWQDDVTDPMGVLAYALSHAGTADRLSFWHVTVDHYRPERPLAVEPQAQATPVGCNFEGEVTLLAADATGEGHLGLFWQAPRALGRDLRATLVLRDAAGHEIARQQTGLAGDLYPTTHWRPGETTLGDVALAAQPGIAAGAYGAALVVYDAATGDALNVLDAAGNPAGQSCPIGDVRLPDGSSGAATDAALAAHALRPQVAEWPGLRLLGAGTCPGAALPPGADLSLPLLWRVTGTHANGAIAATLAAAGEETRLPADPLTPSATGYAWRQGDVVLTWLDLTLPAAAPAGDVALRLEPAEGGAPGSTVTLCMLSVEAVT